MDLINELTFQDETFKGLEYPRITLEKKEFESCRFINCNFSSSHFSSCYFDGCTFDNCNLSTINVDDCVFRNVTFIHSKLLGILWFEIRKRGFSLFARYQACILNYSSFYGLDLRKCTFDDVHAIEADFTEADLSKVRFNNTDLSGATFYQTNLKKADFTSAVNYQFNPSDNRVKDAAFSMPEAVNLLYGFGIKIRH